MKVSSKVSIWLVLAVFFSFSALQQRAYSQDGEVKLPSKKVVRLTQQQLNNLRNQPGISYSPDLPPASVAKGEVIFEVPAELGGGYLWGTPEAIATGLNSVGATVGATAAFVEGLGLYTVGAYLAGASVCVGGIAAALGGGGGGGTTSHSTPSHH